jgi:hypothetical protein
MILGFYLLSGFAREGTEVTTMSVGFKHYLRAWLNNAAYTTRVVHRAIDIYMARSDLDYLIAHHGVKFMASWLHNPD